MIEVDFLVIGAGVSGLGFANAIADEARRAGRTPPTVLVAEAADEPGGYCRTVKQDGFVWDYSGHFFHFRHPEIEAWLRERMPGQDVRTIERRALIRFAGADIDFPFQKNIHQLARQDFIDCLTDLYFRDEGSHQAPAGSFAEMLYQRYGRGIAERFLIPYNQKLYATDLGSLDRDAMGRFFPHADIADILRHMRSPERSGYNATFTYPAGGAIEYIHALCSDLRGDSIALGEPVVAIDRATHVATTPKRTIRYRHLVSSAPLPGLCKIAALTHDPAAFRWNQVLVYNLGFDGKGASGVHWMYFPDPMISFYRVGWYDNLMGGERMSLYVELGMPAGAAVNVDATLKRVLADLEREGLVSGQKLVSWHSVVLDPAYVHISASSIAERDRLRTALAADDIHSIGRYGGWTYCSIEDNIVEARAQAARLAAG